MSPYEKIILFNSIILVFWSVAFVPMVLKAKMVWPLWISCIFIVPIEIILYSEVEDYPLNVLRSVFMFFLALAGGFIMHNDNIRKELEQNTNSDLRKN